MKNTTFITIFLIAVLYSYNSYGQNEYSTTIKLEAETMVESLKEKDFESLMHYTYPRLIELAGGKDILSKRVSESLNQMENDGVMIIDAIIGEPENTFIAGEELHCLVPQEIVMRVPNGKLISNSFLLAISKDNGKSWYFLDTNQMTIENIKQLIPTFNNALKLPPKTAPQFIPN